MCTPSPWPEAWGSGYTRPFTSDRFAGTMLHVLAAARIDRERFAAEHPRHLVGVETRGVDDGARVNRLALGSEHHAVRSPVGADQPRTGQKHGAGVRAGPQQRLDQFLGVHDAGFGRPDGGRPRGSPVREPSMNARSTILRPSTPFASPLAQQRLEFVDFGVVARDDQLAAPARARRRSSPQYSYSRRRPSTHSRAFSVPAG